MGRRPDTPEQQAAKGNPGRRSGGKMAARKALIERVTEVLSPIPAGVEVAPPKVLEQPGFEIALGIWRRLAPELKRTHRLPGDAYNAFVTYCCTYAEWLETQIDIADKGRTQKVPTVSGGMMERDRPAVRHRQQAFDNMLKLSERFGLTPRDTYSLFKDQRLAFESAPGLFDQPGTASAPKSSDDATAEAPAVVSPIGAAARHRSSPPVH